MLDDFVDDAPWVPDTQLLVDVVIDNQIAGVRLQRLCSNADVRGALTVLGSDLQDPSFAAPHVYHVLSEPGSVRAWVYHRLQSDRLAYLIGDFRVVLFDARSDSATSGQMNVLDVGAANPLQLTIPPYVVHGVQNRGQTVSWFINMPTRSYDPARPDKSRVRADHPGIPYRFD